MLYRPHIPYEVRCRVALRQLGGYNIDAKIESEHPAAGGLGYEKLLRTVLLPSLVARLGCTVSDLRLDHNPALGLRRKRRTGQTVMRGGVLIDVVKYTPDANDPDALIYRDDHAHHIKTNVRGDGAQFSDTALMKRERRRKKKAAAKPCGYCGRVHMNGCSKVRRATLRSGRKVKATIPARVDPWGPKGSRKFGRQ